LRKKGRVYTPFTHILRKKLQIRIPFVTNDFATGKAPNRDDLVAAVSLQPFRDGPAETKQLTIVGCWRKTRLSRST
jgi:hypothetical protein